MLPPDGRIDHPVLSTHVEVVRSRKTLKRLRWRALHARGGGPRMSVVCRGTTVVLSTHVEVVRIAFRLSCSARRALHARGGGPPGELYAIGGSPCSPRTWRWSGHGRSPGGVRIVLSTHVEVVRWVAGGAEARGRALHARGGGPVTDTGVITSAECSPRTWRWSDRSTWPGPAATVLSTHVEVVRARVIPAPRGGCALHARGGGP